MKPGGRDVHVFNDDLFSQLRKQAGIPDDFVDIGWSFDSLQSGGAKGGCLLAFVGSQFVVKELSASDHKSLLTLSNSYFQHAFDGDTLLSGFLAHFEDVATSRRFVVMRNVIGSGPFLAMYDLKGCNDDKTLQLFGSKIQSVSRFNSSSQDWHAYSAGKHAAAKAQLVVTESQREEVIRKIRRDTEWLARHSLMDYSLMVGVKTLPADSVPEATFGQTPLSRKCPDGSQLVVCVGIIDFLQQWNLKKMCARAIKCMECNKATIPPAAYARRFANRFEDRFVSVRESENQTLFGKAQQLEMSGAPTKNIGLNEVIQVAQVELQYNFPREVLQESVDLPVTPLGSTSPSGPEADWDNQIARDEPI